MVRVVTLVPRSMREGVRVAERDAEIAALKAELEAQKVRGGVSARRKGAAPWWIVVLIVLLVGGVGFAALVDAGGQSAGPAASASERIAESCEREYGARGEEAVNDCRIRLSIEHLQKAEAGKMERARSGAGL